MHSSQTKIASFRTLTESSHMLTRAYHRLRRRRSGRLRTLLGIVQSRASWCPQSHSFDRRPDPPSTGYGVAPDDNGAPRGPGGRHRRVHRPRDADHLVWTAILCSSPQLEQPAGTDASVTAEPVAKTVCTVLSALLLLVAVADLTAANLWKPPPDHIARIDDGDVGRPPAPRAADISPATSRARSYSRVSPLTHRGNPRSEARAAENCVMVWITLPGLRCCRSGRSEMRRSSSRAVVRVGPFQLIFIVGRGLRLAAPQHLSRPTLPVPLHPLPSFLLSASLASTSARSQLCSIVRHAPAMRRHPEPNSPSAHPSLQAMHVTKCAPEPLSMSLISLQNFRWDCRNNG